MNDSSYRVSRRREARGGREKGVRFFFFPFPILEKFHEHGKREAVKGSFCLRIYRTVHHHRPPRPLYYGPREGRGKKSSSVLRAHVRNAFIRSLAPLPRTTIATSHVYVLRGKHSSACRCSRTRSRAITVENVNNPRRYAINPRTLSIIFPGCVGTIVTTSGRGTRKNRDFVCHDYYLFASIGFNDLPFAILFPDIRQ